MTLFAQLMDFPPQSRFGRIVARYHADRLVQTLARAAHFQVVAVIQPTRRTSLRHIEACPAAQTGKRYQMGFRERVHRSTLAAANRVRDRRIRAAFGQRLVVPAPGLHAGDDLRARRP